MEREEQIIEKSKEYYDVPNLQMRVGFIEGAKWADANPQFSKKEFIEKAVKWLEELADGFIIRSKVIGYDCDKKFLIEDFKQRMEK